MRVDGVRGIECPASRDLPSPCRGGLPALYEDLLSKGVPFTGESVRQAWGGILVDFLDPHGNRLHFVQLP
jgi:hypothetical protein